MTAALPGGGRMFVCTGVETAGIEVCACGAGVIAAAWI
jgi:hypothetical protein